MDKVSVQVGTPKDIKSLIDKPGGASKIMALARIIDGFFKKYPNAKDNLPSETYRVLKELSETDIFKYAFIIDEKSLELLKKLEESLYKHSKTKFPPLIKKDLDSLLNSVRRYTRTEEVPARPGAGPQKIPAKSKKAPSKPGKAPEKVLKKPEKAKPGRAPGKKEPEKSVLKAPGDIDILKKWFKSHYYNEIYRFLPPEIRRKLDKAELDPDVLYSKKMAMRVVNSFLQRSY